VFIFLGQLVYQLVMAFISCPDEDTTAQGEEDAVDENSFLQKAKRKLQKLAIPLKKITKIVATWLFCLGTLSRTAAARQLKDFGQRLLRVMESAATASPMGTGAASCLTENPLYTHFLYCIVGFVPTCLLIAAIIFIGGVCSSGKKKQWPISAGVTFVAIACLMYPEILVTAINLLACETLEFPFLANEVTEKNQTVFHHLEYDRRISCSTDTQYERFRYGAWAVGSIFGIAGPIACIIYGSYFSTKVFEYLTAGLKPQAWFWELVTMLRKVILLTIVTIVKQQSLLLMSYTVANYFFLLLTLLVQPYEGSRLYNVLEVFGTTTMVVVALHLSAVSEFPDDAGNVMIGIAILIFMSLVVVVGVTARVLMTQETKSVVPSSAQRGSTDASPGAGGDEEMTDLSLVQRNHEDEIHRLKVELAAKVREAEELQRNRRVDKAQIDRLEAENNRLKKENASMVAELAALKKEMQELQSGRQGVEENPLCAPVMLPN